MSEPDDPGWLDEIGPELRKEVPVREAWRARLLDAVARAPRHSGERDRRIIMRPLTGVAAALVFAALGAGATLAAMAWRTRDDGAPAPLASNPARGAGSMGVSDPNGSADREVVRFELSAPKATHVALVGSFNRWNPVATPLERDPGTGKWVVALRLPPGRHVYAFVVDGDVTADPAAPRAADDDFGSSNSVVLVSGRTS